MEKYDDQISRQAAIDALKGEKFDGPFCAEYNVGYNDGIDFAVSTLSVLPSAQSEQLTDDDFETIRIHLSAYKEKLCNQRRWKEAEEYQRIIDRFMAFASAQSTVDVRKTKPGKWIFSPDHSEGICSECHYKIYGRPYNNTYLIVPYNFCPNCGAKMDKGDSAE